MTIVLRAGSATDAGRVRTSNQDRVVVVDGRLFAVADGMGGHRGGEVAAQMVADGLREFAEFETESVSPGSIESRLRALNTTILRAASGSDDLFGMGTTLTMVVQADRTSTDGSLAVPAIYVVNIGDSRTYLLRNGALEQLTEDHSVVADLVREGRISEDEARSHRQRSVITRTLGVDANVEPDILEITPAVGSRYVLCSDGLPNEVPDALIGAVLRRLADPTDAARELVRLALERGGHDNVSVVVVDVTDDSGHDSLAAAASEAVSMTAVASSVADVRGTGEPERAPLKRDRRVKRVRRPSPINLRVLVFLALLAGIAALAYAVITQAPNEAPATEQTVLTGVTTTVFVGPTAPIDDFAPDATEPGGVTTDTVGDATAGTPSTQRRTRRTTGSSG